MPHCTWRALKEMGRGGSCRCPVLPRESWVEATQFSERIRLSGSSGVRIRLQCQETKVQYLGGEDPGERNGYRLSVLFMENSMDRGPGELPVHTVGESWT